MIVKMSLIQMIAVSRRMKIVMIVLTPPQKVTAMEVNAIARRNVRDPMHTRKTRRERRRDTSPNETRRKTRSQPHGNPSRNP